jgi:hypothetical protein
MPEVLASTTSGTKNAVLCDMTMCGSSKNRCFGGMYHLQPQGAFDVQMETTYSTETSVIIKGTRRHIPEDGILYCYLRENIKKFILKISGTSGILTFGSKFFRLELFYLSRTFLAYPWKFFFLFRTYPTFHYLLVSLPSFEVPSIRSFTHGRDETVYPSTKNHVSIESLTEVTC